MHVALVLAAVMHLQLAAPTSGGAHYVELAPSVGYATLTYRRRGADADTTVAFGMRQPFWQRTMPRVIPTVRLPSLQPGSRVGVELRLDDEAPDRPLVQIIDGAQLAAEDRATARLVDVALFFIGIFVSLAAANMFVFAFVRDRSYLIYFAWMLVNTVFAATYLHRSAWAWLWPWAGLPDVATTATIVLLEMLCLVAFARAFMNTAKVVPNLDRIALRVATTAGAIAVLMAYGFAKLRWIPVMPGRGVFLLCIVTIMVVTLWLGVAALRAGSRPARFFVASNAIVSLVAIGLAVANAVGHAAASGGTYLALMGGQSVEGWILFGALASRLDSTMRATRTDALTGVGNRRAFDERLANEWERCARTGSPLSLLMIDIDHFKAYNDLYGHVRGDAALRRIAGTTAGRALRPADATARYGGEEFAVILGETSAKGACDVAAAILEDVRALAIAHSGSPPGIVTISIGVATLTPVPRTTPSIVAVADEALYRAKAKGRNRLEITACDE